jgi:hypothetical protein
VANALGLILIVIGWFQISGSAFVHTQVGWLNLAIAGAAFAGAGNALLILRARRTVALAKAIVVVEAERIEASGRFGARATSLPELASRRADRLLYVPGTNRYHRSRCLLVVGKGSKLGPRAELERRGLAPCGVCEP